MGKRVGLCGEERIVLKQKEKRLKVIYLKIRGLLDHILESLV